MKKLLITGFEPFGGESINPSLEAVFRLPSVIGDYEIFKLGLPVVFGEAYETALAEAERIRPDAIICVGQAGGRDAITPELVAINLRYADIPDNNGNLPKDTHVIEGDDLAYFSTLPVRKMAEAIKENGIPARLSYTAGGYVCNDLLYSLLSHFKGSEVGVCFIHIPYCTEQNKEPSMELEKIVKGLTVAIETI